MQSHLTHVVCLECGHELTGGDLLVAACPTCNSPWLDARYDYAAVAPLWSQGINGRDASLWRYGELLPIPEADPVVSFREGYSPLVRLYQYENMYDHPHLYLKDERQGPTSSFKDRQAALAVTAMRQAGITECVLASTGNAAAAYAAYCARAGIKLWLFLTSLVPSEKMREAALYGAEVVKVSGTYDETKKVAHEFADRKGIHLDRGAKAIPGKESMKTLAYEIAEQLGLQLGEGEKWRAPDWYIQAVSGGIDPLGVWKGFNELHQMGLIDWLPKLAIMQAAGCAPMVEAFHAGKATADPVVPKTLITVLATGDPGFSYVQLRQAILENGGLMMAIEDGETFAAMRRAASKAGFSVEPATAVAFAGLEKMLGEAMIEDDEVVALNCSGHTFPAESHILGDQFVLDLELESEGGRHVYEGLGAALQGLDEQITTILVVDDEPTQRRLIRRLLRSYKRYRVFEARSGIEALQMVDQHKPDLIVADLMMPEMDGFTLLEQLKWNEATANIPVVVVSAKNLTLTDRQTLDKYSDSVWVKGGFNTRDLVSHIVETLGDAPIGHDNAPKESYRVPTLDSPDDNADRKYTVLVIDDDVKDARLARRLIEASGSYRVIMQHTGRDGLKAAYEYRPDLIVLDLSLPDMDGFTVLESIQEDLNLADIPVIVYSGRDLNRDELQHLDTRIRSVIEKAGFNREQFVSLIHDALN
jgi:threonine synthase